ncbi:Carbonic anhydrase [Caenorhabditis elegans]|uniref:Carbonic anhydrase n=1 Tax=Caenorhabditis elegans TaxID=6239 RepID=Q8I102_CAEEL|nr:Carbonic anhydrase [Caenorhabditis elegans]CAD56250.2 Carbonic anhydrase [Caenorhabditis elegans]|eukprot:NP_872092.2 Carbonic anhydrase [Caenorhabditis elegans]
MPGLERILNGVIRFRQTVRKDLVKQFERIRDNPHPTAVFFTCMDSRMLPARFSAVIDPEDKLNVEDKLSQINTLQQLENVASHGFLKEFLVSQTVDLHAMWFDIYTGEMHMFSKPNKQFVLVDESNVEELIDEVEKHQT